MPKIIDGKVALLDVIRYLTELLAQKITWVGIEWDIKSIIDIATILLQINIIDVKESKCENKVHIV